MNRRAFLIGLLASAAAAPIARALPAAVLRFTPIASSMAPAPGSVLTIEMIRDAVRMMRENSIQREFFPIVVEPRLFRVLESGRFKSPFPYIQQEVA
jgi:hypothetical protein